ncbi:MAG TPA: hypothetical protein VF183_10205, partial [Acidimicrobiales bacterium]
MAFIDLTGRRFDRLVVLRRDANRGTQPYWLARCDCGKEAVVQGGHLRSGTTRSCGCLCAERVRASLTKHGHRPKSRPSPEYSSWMSMRRRCISDREP